VICEAPAGQSCEGNGRLSSTERLSGKRAIGLSAKRSSTRRVALGETTFTTAAGQTKTVAVALNGTAHSLLDRFHGVPVALTVTLTNGPTGERTAVANRTLTIIGLHTERVAKEIERRIVSQRHIRAEVTCPVVVIQLKGNNFTCIATRTVGKGKHTSREQTHFDVIQVDDEGHVEYGAV
jgi:hypothetical protein